MPGAELGRHLRLLLLLLRSKRQAGIESAACRSFSAVGFTQAVFFPMEAIVGGGITHLGYCRFIWDDGPFSEYLAHRNYSAQLAPPCHGYDAVASAVTEPITPKWYSEIPAQVFLPR